MTSTDVERPSTMPPPGESEAVAAQASFAQERLWFLQELEPNSPAYHMPAALRLSGPLEVERFRRSINAVVARHEVLRTTFHIEDGVLFQVILPTLEIDVPVEDACGLGAQARDAELRRRMAEEARAPFDLAAGPLLRVRLVRVAEEEHVLLLTVHHIVSDDWSMGVLVREVALFYSGFAGSAPLELPELSVQYADYAAWQREVLSGEVLEQKLSYWRRKLAGAPPLELPTDRPRPPQKTYRGAHLPVELPRELTEGLRRLSREEGVTLFMALLAGWQLLLSRYAGQRDVVVGSPIAGRQRAELEALIGVFVNTLALRTDLGGRPSFRELVGRVKETCLEAYAHQEVPFERIVEELQPERDLSRAPLFQAMLVLQNAPPKQLELAELTLEHLELESGTSKFDLTLMLEETAEERLAGSIEYDTDLFDATTIEQMWESFEVLLGAALEQPEQRADELPILKPEVRQRVTQTYASGPRMSVTELLVHQRISEQAAQKPKAGALAVGFSDEALSYAFVDAWSNRLANYLRSLGVGRGDRVGVHLQRSIERVVSLLAIVKAGAAFVPLDVELPPARLNWMREESRCRVVIVKSTGWRGERGGCILDLDAEALAIGDCAPTVPHSDVGPDDAAYVIYTSGSTGRPKGVVNHHGAMLNRLAWMQSVYPLDDTDRVVQKTPYSFDVSVWEFFWPLMAGARLVVAPPGAHRDPHELAQLIDQDAITVIHFVPSMLQAFVDSEVSCSGATLRHVICSGEALTPQLADRYHQRFDAPLHNLYGPTEAAIDVTYFDCRAKDDLIPIGRPIANTQVYVLDGRMQAVPDLVPGELYLGGVQLARGYIERPDLTAARFVPSPFSSEGAERLYRTGDRVRWRRSGMLEYLGRIDHQVKVRGFRIELGEIESALLREPEVRAACASVHGTEGGAKRLVAYVVGEDSGSIEIDTLRARIESALPHYMIPSLFVVLDELPLTPSGKIDRRVLPEPDPPSPTSAYVPPRSDIEELVAGVFADVLGVERVGARDGFFKLGGHSLLATQAVSRLRSSLDVELPLRSLFEAPTVAGVAERVEAALRKGESAELPAIEPAPAGAEPVMSIHQERLWFIDRLYPGSSAYNMGVAVRLKGDIRPEWLHRAFELVIERHETLRMQFGEAEGTPGVEILEQPEFDLPVYDLRSESRERIERRMRDLVAEVIEQPFDLSVGPLLRANAIRTGEEELVLSYCVHHIVADGWSLNTLAREVVRYYDALRRREQPALPAPRVSYTDFARWQRAWLESGEGERQLEYWGARLEGAPEANDLPTDFQRPPVQRYHGGHHRLVAEDLGTELTNLGRATAATPFMVLYAGFSLLLARLTGQEDVVVGAPVANRRHPDVEELIGFFMNSLALRLDVSGDPTFRQLVARARDTCLDAYRNQDVPFEQVLERVAPNRDLSRTPLFQVFLNMLNFEASSPSPDLDVEVLEAKALGAKFDVTAYVDVDSVGPLCVEFVYNKELFLPERIEELGAQLELLLKQGLADPDTPVSQFSLVTPRAASRLPSGVRRLDDSWRGSVPELFERHAAREPDAPCILYGGATYSYGQISEATNAFSAELRECGAARGRRVAIIAHRSPDLVVSLLSTMKSGASFVLLDPSYPHDRLLYCLKAAKPCSVVLTDRVRESRCDLADSLESLGSSVLGVGREGVGERIGCGAEDLMANLGPDDEAYVSFTSGTTGKPKGVVGRHGSLTHFTPWQAEHFGLRASDRYTMLSGLAHDPLHRDVFTPLQTGAVICIPDENVMGDALALARWMQQEQVTVSHFTPAMCQLVCDASDLLDEPVESLRLAFFVGEKLRRHDVRMLEHLAPNVRCVNSFGSTETQRAVSYHQVDRCSNDDGPGVPKELIPVGRGMPDVEILVVTSSGRLGGTGEVGEIVMRSPHLALGYLDDHELTARKFTHNPLSKAASIDRVYRTGDLGRYRPDGSVDVIGRADRQVKIRGFRVELGEIESVLGGMEGVADAVVQVREKASSGPGLCAYVVMRSDADFDADEVRRALHGSLPDYMVPSQFVLLDRVPLTPNGKVDRKALPEPEVAISKDYAPPRNGTEEFVAEIFSELLRGPRVGAHDNFFELGGHSLLATQVVSRMRRSLGVELPLRSLFEAPTVAGVAARVEAALHEGAGSGLPPIEAVDREGELPLSFGQERLWFLDQLEGESAAHNLPGAVRLRGELDEAALRQSLSEFVRRHEVLRSSFDRDKGRPQLVIEESAELALPVVDLTSLERSERERRLEELAVEEARKPFDLRRAPLVRSKLLRLSLNEHVLLFTMHHIASDGWSRGILVREVASLYEAKVARKPSPLPELAVQYVDYANWQRDVLAGQLLEEQLAYWREKLAGAPPLGLPTDRPRPAQKSYRGAHFSVELGRELTGAVQELSRREGTTTFMTLLAGFQVVLSRYARQRDVVVGSPIAGRRQSELEALVGFFVNMLALRTDLSGRPSFRSLLSRVRETCLQAYAHQDVPFERVVEELQPERDLSRTPLFQVMFVLQNAPRRELEVSGLEIAQLELESGTSQFDMTLSLSETSAGTLAGRLEYDTDLFDADTIERVWKSLEVLLGAAVVHPDETICELPLLDEDEQRQLEVEWNDTFAAVPSCSLPALIAQTVERKPEEVAVIAGEQQLSYRQLWQRAGWIGQGIAERGVGFGDRVGLCLGRSADLLVAVLGVLRAGAAYVPLDPSYPAERLRYMLGDSGARLVVTEGGGVLSERSCEALTLEQLTAGPSGWRGPSLVADALAYVIYTSGSTGLPKGVEIEHRAVVNFLSSMAQEPGCEESDLLLAVTSLSFDIAVLELLLPLIVGAQVVLADEETTRDGRALGRLLDSSGATMMQATPSTWRMVLESEWPGAERIRILCGGEALAADLARDLGERAPEVWNMYGPTETTVWSSLSRVRDAHVTLGRPIANTAIHTVDEELHQVPVNVPGEIVIGGDGMARGYHQRPGMTAERFIPDPFSVNGNRLYRTGDLGRYRTDGTIDYLGRLDHQVKVRGHRIELGEVASVLRELESVRDCVVVRHGEGSQAGLAAYVVLAPGATVDELKAHLDARLPGYMVPSWWTTMDALPLTPNRKVDRNALPAPEAPSSRHYVRPRDGKEQVVAAIFADVLGIDRVGAHDSFFEMGGHSLLATQLVSRLTTAFEVELQLRSLFEAPTVAGMAETVDRAVHQGYDDQAPPLVRRPPDAPKTLSFAQERFWFIEQLNPGDPLNYLCSAMRLDGSLDSGALTNALNRVIARHAVLRANFVAEDGQPAIVVQDRRRLRPAVADRLGEVYDEESAINEVRVELEKPFNIEKDLLIRARLVHYKDDVHLLILVVHHIIADALSMGNLLQEVIGAMTAPEQPPEPLPVDYFDYSAWQRELVSGPRGERQLRYWSARLGDAPRLELPFRAESHGEGSGEASIGIGAESVEALHQLGAAHGCTPFMVVTAVVKLVLARLARQEDVVVGAPVAHRRDERTENLIGLFLNTVILRTHLGGNPSFEELLERVRATSLEAYENQDVPFERVIQEVGSDRELGRSPIFDVLINGLPENSAEFHVDNLSVKTVGTPPRARLPLTLYVVERGSRISIKGVYQRTRFDDRGVSILLEQVKSVLEQAVETPNQHLNSFSLATPSARGIIQDPTEPLEPPSYPWVSDCVRDWAERTPDAVAVAAEDRDYTYLELVDRVDALATALVQDGLEKGEVVGVTGERCFGFLVSVLAVMEAGGVMMPIDPALPARRRTMMMDITNAERMIAAGSSAAPEGDRSRVFRVGRDSRGDLDPLVDRALRLPERGPDDPCDIFFTSGSTGKPKAVLGRSRGVSHFIAWQRDQFGVCRGDRLAQLTAYSFNPLRRDLYLPITSGATLCMPPANIDPLGGELTLRWMQRERISLLHCVPSVAQTWLACTPEDVTLPDLRWAFFAGEPLMGSLVARWRRAYPTCQVAILYGQTETTLAKCSRVLPEEPPPGVQPVGRPLPYSQVIVLDDHMRRCGVGEVGEVVMRTPFRSLGYLHQGPEQARFVQSPFRPQDRRDVLYRTGDFGRYRADGALELIGRVDFQTKIRGVRVQPGEVAGAVLRLEGVQSCVVTTATDPGGEQQLVGYVVPNPGEELTPAGLRRQLSRELPRAMVPGAFVFLEDLPLLSTGKVDRQRLPDPDWRVEEAEVVAPRNPLEELIVSIWKEVLSVDDIGVTTDFFSVGGDSLSATRLISRIRERCDRRILVRDFFENPTVAGLADQVEKAGTNSDGDVTEASEYDASTENEIGEQLHDVLAQVGVAEEGDLLPDS